MRFVDFYEKLKDDQSISSAKEFAKELGVSASLITEIVKKRTNIGVKVIQNSVLKFNLNSDWLFTGHGEMFRPHDLTPNQTTDATIDKLIKEVKELSAENALLKDENKRLIKDKSNTRTHAPVVTEP
ncbi:MAG: hypothetical protein QM237_10760 [Bacteroidota bacterium]|nr:hypothetical protein [Bacteroidota bacterium]